MWYNVIIKSRKGDYMCNKTCDRCKYAEWDYVDAYYGGYWAVDGCNMPEDAPITDDSLILNADEDWNDEWGDTKDCPYFEENFD